MYLNLTEKVNLKMDHVQLLSEKIPNKVSKLRLNLRLYIFFFLKDTMIQIQVMWSITKILINYVVKAVADCKFIKFITNY